MEVARGIHRQTLGIANWYLIEDRDKLTAVDAGTTSDWAVLGSALTTLGRTLGDLEAVILTHAHSDHTGFAERARKEAGARIFVHAIDEPQAKGAKPLKNEAGIAKYVFHRETYRTVFGLLREGGIRIVPIAEVSTFADGEVIDVPGRPRAVHTPGHTDGSAAVLFEDRSVVCTGDGLVTHNVLTGRPGPQIMPSAFNRSSAQALQSLSALEKTGAGLLLPGHGDPWTDGIADAVRLARAAGPS